MRLNLSRHLAANGGNGSSSGRANHAQRDYRKKPVEGEERHRVQSRTGAFLSFSMRWFALLFVLAGATLLVAPNLFYRQPDYRVNESLDHPVRARISFTMTDEVALQKQVEALSAELPFLYDFIADSRLVVEKRLDRLFKEAGKISGNADLAGEEKLEALDQWLREEQQIISRPYLAEEILNRSGDEEFQSILKRVFDHIYESRGVVDNSQRYLEHYMAGRLEVDAPASVAVHPEYVVGQSDIERYTENLFERGGAFEGLLGLEDKRLVALISRLYIRPSITLNSNATEKRRREMVLDLREHPPESVVRFIKKGQVLAPAGRPISPESLAQIEKMHEVYDASLLRHLFAAAVYVGLLICIVFYYFRHFRADLVFNTRNVFLVATPVLLALVIGRLALEFLDPPDAAPYLFASGLIGMLAMILLDAGSAILLVTVGSLAFGVATGLDFKVLFVSLMGGYAASAALTSARRRWEILRAGLVAGLVNAAVIFLVNFIDNPTEMQFGLMFWGVGNGILCSVVALSTLWPFFEKVLGVVTDIGLLELTGLDHPLLRRMEEKAPGSYQHCLNVCKLAEAAARAIGANHLLVRAGAYYHDIGKTLKPRYFGENQITLEEKSMHSKLSPYMSAMVIKNHVKAGIELAEEYGLPERVADFIPQHHGTTMISYFYNQALQRFENSQSTDPVREEDFRYPGPKPQFIETAIIMLADSVEATVTSRFTSLSINEDELRLCVRKSVQDKFADGQFDECNLTLRDLHVIQETFVKTLLGRFHHRIAYPTTPGLSGPVAPTSKRDRMDRDPKEKSRGQNATAHAGVS